MHKTLQMLVPSAHPEESIVFQGLIEYIWTSRVRLYHYVKSLQTVVQLGILLLWWQRHGRMRKCSFW